MVKKGKKITLLKEQNKKGKQNKEGKNSKIQTKKIIWRGKSPCLQKPYNHVKTQEPSF